MSASETLNLDIWEWSPDHGSYLGQVTATFDPAAQCEPCEEGWEQDRTHGIIPRLANRPIPGAFRFIHPDGREEVWCLGHIQDAPDLAACP